MGISILCLSDNRRLIIGHPNDPWSDALSDSFVALLSAFDAADLRHAEVIAGRLLARGCLEFCCVGPAAEQLHDLLDGLVEDLGAFDVVTTWEVDPIEACEYFLFAAAGKPSTLLALVAAHPDLVASLESEALQQS